MDLLRSLAASGSGVFGIAPAEAKAVGGLDTLFRAPTSVSPVLAARPSLDAAPALGLCRWPRDSEPNAAAIQVELDMRRSSIDWEASLPGHHAMGSPQPMSTRNSIDAGGGALGPWPASDGAALLQSLQGPSASGRTSIDAARSLASRSGSWAIGSSRSGMHRGASWGAEVPYAAGHEPAAPSGLGNVSAPHGYPPSAASPRPPSSPSTREHALMLDRTSGESDRAVGAAAYTLPAWAVPAPLFVVSGTGKEVLAWNPAMARLSGYSEAEMLHRRQDLASLFSARAGEAGSLPFVVVMRAASAGTPAAGPAEQPQFLLHTRDGGYLPVGLSASAASEQPGCADVVVVASLLPSECSPESSIGTASAGASFDPGWMEQASPSAAAERSLLSSSPLQHGLSWRPQNQPIQESGREYEAAGVRMRLRSGSVPHVPPHLGSLSSRGVGGSGGGMRAAPGVSRRSAGCPAGEPALAGLRALVVEDAEVPLLLHGTMLRRMGFEVDFATDGSKAARFFGYGALAPVLRPDGTAPYHVVLMDVGLPYMDGIQATREIRRLQARAGCGRTPILAVTDLYHEDDFEQQSAAGGAARPEMAELFDGLLRKPVRYERLRAVLMALCGRGVAAEAAGESAMPLQPAALAALGGASFKASSPQQPQSMLNKLVIT